MPAQVLNGPAVAVHMYQALFGQAPSNALYASYISQIGSTDGAAFAASIAGGFASTTDAALATKVLANLGVTATTMPATATVTAAAGYTALETALTSMFTGYGVAARGQIILNMTNLLANLEGDVTFGTIATAYNTQTLNNFTYSSNTANTTPAAVTTATATVGSSLTLTDKIGEIVTGTAGNDTISAVIGGTGAATDATLNLGDTIDGGAGTDTLTLLAGSAATPLPAGVTVKNVEIVNVNVTSATAATASFLKSSTYEGVKELWQVNTGAAAASANFQKLTVAADVTAGLRGNNKVGTDGANASVTIDGTSATQKSLSIALDGVGTGTVLTEGVGTTETITISGSVAKATTTTAGVLSLNAGGDALTVNGAFTSDVNIGTGITGAKIKTIDLSKSTGGVELNSTGLTATLETVKGGAGNDKLTVDLGVKLVTVDLGAGNDSLTFADAVTSDGKELSVTLGAGKDTLNVGVVKNVIDTADLTKGLVTVTDFKIGEDTIDLTAGVTLTGAQLDTAKNAASLKAAIESVLSVVTEGKDAVFSYGGDAYIFVNNDEDASGATNLFAAGDGLIKLVGLDATLLSTNQNGGLVL